MTKIISISVSDEHKKLLDDMELSPSGLFKQRMEQIKEDSFNYNNKMNLLQRAREAMEKEMQNINSELDKYKEKYGAL